MAARMALALASVLFGALLPLNALGATCSDYGSLSSLVQNAPRTLTSYECGTANGVLPTEIGEFTSLTKLCVYDSCDSRTAS